MAIDPTTGKLFSFNDGVGGWNTGTQTPAWAGGNPAPFGYSTDSGVMQNKQPGVDGISPELMQSVGYGPQQANASYTAARYSPSYDKENFDGGAGQVSGDFGQILDDKGLHLAEKPAPGTNQAYQQLFDKDNNPSGQAYRANLEQDPGGIFAMAAMAAMGFGGAAALGAGAAGAGAGEGVSGMDLAADAGYDGANGIGGAASSFNAPGEFSGIDMSGGAAGQPAQGGQSLFGQAKDAYDYAKKGKGLYDQLMGGQQSQQPQGDQSGIAAFLSGMGGMSAGDRFRQQNLAQSLREKAQPQGYSPGPGWIPGG